MKKTVIILCALLLSAASFAQTYNHDFTQTRRLKVSGKTTVMKGHLNYDGKEKLSMTYSDPEGDYFIIDGNMVKMSLMGKSGELDANKVPMVALQRSTLLNCLSGNWKQAAEDNNATTTVTEKTGFRTVKITAAGIIPRGGYKSVTLTYRIKDGRVSRLILEEPAGIENTYEMR